MADWLKFECSLPDKPETLAITAAMGWDDPDTTVGKLMRLFRWFDQHTTDGNASGVTAALLDRVIGVAGFVQAVSNAHWLTISETGLRLENFDRHNGTTAKTRALTAKRVANHRASGHDDEAGNAPDVTEPLAREDKRRREKKEKGPATPALSPRATVVQTIPCPYDEIVKRYHARLPDLPAVRLMSPSRERSLRERWGWVFRSSKPDGTPRATTADEALAWFDAYFARASANDFLMGRSARSGEHANWQCDLDFLLTEKGMRHVIEKTRTAA